MPKICVLPDVVASQVAAGEVVERPASVVKELVENSLDAGARQIEVRIDRGGIALIRVSDDGCGMGREDALLSLERHATSKLRHAADLETILTLGFRGEALPSIASVSHFTLATREPGALAGTEISVDGGRLRDVRDWGGAPGTEVEVRQLFSNVPARRKFLRSENTEFGHIEQVVRVQALAHPGVGFTLLRDGRVVFQLPARATLYDRITGLIGPDLAASLVERPPAERDGLRVHGWLARPGRGRGDRSLCLVFVNGRPVENPALTHALRAAYGDTLGRGQHPMCFLFIGMDPAAVDVNVHPAKRDVRFRDGLGVQSALSALLQERLRSDPVSAAAAAAAPLAAAEWVPRDVRKPRDGPFSFPGEIEVPSPPIVRTPAAQPILPVVPASAEAPAEPPVPPRAPSPGIDPVAGPVSDPPTFRLLGLLADTYAVLEGIEGLVLMDLRGAHERILYESLRRRAEGGAVPSQPLLVPYVLTLPPREVALVRDHLALFHRLGFGLEEFGANTLKLEALPADLPGGDPGAWLSELLRELAQSGESGLRLRHDFDSLAAVVSTRATPRTASRSPAEVESLLSRLLTCEMPYCDPIGRPTLVQFSHQELARKFGRK